MRKIGERYENWLLSVRAPEEKSELLRMDEATKSDAFFTELSFGTGGLRGIMAMGTNRMNRYTVAKATRGLCRYILTEFPSNKSVAIGYDSRNNSELFAKLAASILASAGVRVHLWPELLPTPMLSYAVRTLGCSVGIMLTASHNPGEYNGYKVYGADGCQITEEAAEIISRHIAEQPTFTDEEPEDFDKLLANGKISYIGEDVYEAFIQEIMANSVLGTDCTENASLKIVYTPLNGTGRRPVTDVLSRCGFKNVHVVREQEMPDGNFPTCPYPNPEIKEAMALGVSYAEKMGADVLLATDPDCDRVGVGTPGPDGRYTLLTGNEIGLLLFDFIAKRLTEDGTMPKHPIVVKTVVTSDLTDRIAQRFGVTVKNVLTGFKYIGETIGALEKAGHVEDYILGFEESCGYLTAGYVRDKDGVLAAMLIAELAAYHRANGKTLYEAICELYKTYGYAKNSLKSYAFTGPQGFADMQGVMQRLRGGVNAFGKYAVEDVLDYAKGIDSLPASDVLKFLLAGGSTLTVRPSGTEPKLKVYFSVSARDSAEASETTEQLTAQIEEIIYQTK